MAKNQFAFGNLKLPKSTAIFNMGPASNGQTGKSFRMHCPEYHKGLCQLADPAKQCYAVKPERRFPKTVTSRKRQAKFWRDSSVDEFVDQFKTESRRTTTHLRFNESGGIATISDIIKLGSIARALPDINIYLYTSRSDLWLEGAFECLPDNVTVNGSGFMAHNSFNARPKNKIPANTFICPADCSVCDVCGERGKRRIFAAMH